MPVKRVTAGQKYLAGWKDIEGSSRCALDPLDEGHTYHTDIGALTSLGYIVSINGRIGNYFVRCLPMRDTPYRVGQPVALSYCGPDLGYVLACAAYEADLLCVATSGAIVSEEEAPRWALKS